MSTVQERLAAYLEEGNAAGEQIGAMTFAPPLFSYPSTALRAAVEGAVLALIDELRPDIHDDLLTNPRATETLTMFFIAAVSAGYGFREAELQRAVQEEE